MLTPDVVPGVHMIEHAHVFVPETERAAARLLQAAGLAAHTSTSLVLSRVVIMDARVRVAYAAVAAGRADYDQVAASATTWS